MTRFKDYIEIFAIMSKYKPDEWLCAEHDIIYLLEEEDITDEQDIKRLKELGAHIEEGVWVVYV